MSNSLTNDYFSFMSDKWERRQTKSRTSIAAPAPDLSADTIDFVEVPQLEEPQIEVVESIATDTIIERIFKRFAKEAG